jgi:hypothetical protein
LSRKELTLTFNPYEVAPYPAGASSVSLPWSTLMPWLTAQVRNDISKSSALNVLPDLAPLALRIKGHLPAWG